MYRRYICEQFPCSRELPNLLTRSRIKATTHFCSSQENMSSHRLVSLLGPLRVSRATLEHFQEVQRISRGVYGGRDYALKLYKAWFQEESADKVWKLLLFPSASIRTFKNCESCDLLVTLLL